MEKYISVIVFGEEVMSKTSLNCFLQFKNKTISVEDAECLTTSFIDITGVVNPHFITQGQTVN